MNRDFIPGKHNYKEWFKIMWENTFLQIGIVFFIMSVLQVTHIRYCMNLLYISDYNWIMELGMWIFPLGLTFIVMFGFIDFWRYLKGQERVHEVIMRFILITFYGWIYLKHTKIFVKSSIVENRSPTWPGDYVRFDLAGAWQRQFKKTKKS